MIMPYNRVVKDLNGYSKDEFITKISDKFDVVKSDKHGDSEVMESSIISFR